MTEERIGELLKQAQEENRKAGYEFLDDLDICQFGCTVAAEARKEGWKEGWKEGIEEMRDAALFAIDHYDGEPLAQVAERLKDKR